VGEREEGAGGGQNLSNARHGDQGQAKRGPNPGEARADRLQGVGTRVVHVLPPFLSQKI